MPRESRASGTPFRLHKRSIANPRSTGLPAFAGNDGHMCFDAVGPAPLDSFPCLAFTFLQPVITTEIRRRVGRGQGRTAMNAIERRAFMKGAGLGALAFTVGGAQVLMTPAQARAEGVPLRTLKPEEAETIEAMGEALVPGARQAGIANFVDQQLSIPAEEALLEARILNVKPPFANFYRAAIGAINAAST